MATSGRHMARFSARDCAIGPVRTVPIHPSSQTTRQDCACRVLEIEHDAALVARVCPEVERVLRVADPSY